jgi:sugar/nucleoside kinase (ribokinase family)
VPDVYAFGVIAPSTLVVLEDGYPPPAGYAEIAGVYQSIGGEAAAGAYVLARLGIATSLDGTRLGADESSTRALEILTAAGVDCSAISRAGGTVTEIVVSAGTDRTVLGTYRKMTADQTWNAPSRESIRSSRIVCLDPFLAGASEQAVRWCREAGTPYVTVDAPPGSEIAEHAAVLVISQEYAARDSRSEDLVLAAYTEQTAGLVILTRGEGTLLYGRRNEHPKEFPPFPVDVRDTTGAGDSFRAGIIYGMLSGLDDEGLIRTGAAVAALVCERFPGVLHSPTANELSGFLAKHA